MWSDSPHCHKCAAKTPSFLTHRTETSVYIHQRTLRSGPMCCRSCKSTTSTRSGQQYTYQQNHYHATQWPPEGPPIQVILLLESKKNTFENNRTLPLFDGGVQEQQHWSTWGQEQGLPLDVPSFFILVMNLWGAKNSQQPKNPLWAVTDVFEEGAYEGPFFGALSKRTKILWILQRKTHFLFSALVRTEWKNNNDPKIKKRIIQRTFSNCTVWKFYSHRSKIDEINEIAIYRFDQFHRFRNWFH